MIVLLLASEAHKQEDTINYGTSAMFATAGFVMLGLAGSTLHGGIGSAGCGSSRHVWNGIAAGLGGLVVMVCCSYRSVALCCTN